MVSFRRRWLVRNVFFFSRFVSMTMNLEKDEAAGTVGLV